MSNLIVIADRVLNNGDTTAVKALPPNDLEKLHYIMTDMISAYTSLSDRIMQHICQYIEALNRYHRGLFWKIFNKFARGLSEIWYKASRLHMDIVFHALVCFSKESVNHWAEVRNLEAVFSYQHNPDILLEV